MLATRAAKGGYPSRTIRDVVSDRRVRRFLRQWRKRYPHPVAWVDDRANKQFRRSELRWLAQFAGAEVLKRREVATLLTWRSGLRPALLAEASPGIEGPAAWGHARRRIKKALAEPSPSAALDLLLGEQGGIPGWGPVAASVVLGACRPDTYVVADERCLRSLVALERYTPRADGTFARADWLPYLAVVRDLAALSELSARQVAQALWAGADRAPELPSR